MFCRARAEPETSDALLENELRRKVRRFTNSNLIDSDMMPISRNITAAP
jgi:hypothetical protein